MAGLCLYSHAVKSWSSLSRTFLVPSSILIFFFVSCPKPVSGFFPLLDPCLSSPVSPSSLSCLHLLPSILSWLRHLSSHLLPLHCLSLTIVAYSCRLRCWTWLPWIEDLSFGPSFSLIPVPHIYPALKSLLPSSVYHLLGTKDW